MSRTPALPSPDAKRAPIGTRYRPCFTSYERRGPDGSYSAWHTFPGSSMAHVQRALTHQRPKSSPRRVRMPRWLGGLWLLGLFALLGVMMAWRG